MRHLPRFLAPLAMLPILANAPTPPAQGSGTPVPKTRAVRLTVETVVVDRRGTWSLGTDVADLFSGDTGTLDKSATLIRRGDESGTREMVQMTARLTPTLDAGGGCVVRLETETRAVVAGGQAAEKKRRPDRTLATIALKPDQERLIDAYASVATQGRLALKVRCGPAPAATVATKDPDLRFVDFLVSVARADGGDEPKPLTTSQLRAAMGRDASHLFSFNVPLDPDVNGTKRYRREKLEVTMTPTLASGGRVQVLIGVRGEMATVAADMAPIAHPVEHEDTVVIASGEPRDVDIDVRSSGPDEGWVGVRYHLTVVGTF